MIIGTLASKANLSEETSVSLIDLISRIFYNEVRQVEDGKVLEMGVMVIVQIIQVCYIYEDTVALQIMCSRRPILLYQKDSLIIFYSVLGYLSFI